MNTFPIGVWAQPNFEFNKQNWTKIPLFTKWANRGAKLFVTNGVNPDTAQNSPLLYCSMAADVGGSVFLMPEIDKIDPMTLLNKPGFGGFMQPDEPDGWSNILKHPDGSYDMPSSIKKYVDRYAAYKSVAVNVPVYGNFTGNFIWAKPDNQAPNATVQNWMDWFGACDIYSFDQYITNTKRKVEDAYPMWQQMITVMRQMTGGAKPIMNYIETSDYDTTSPDNGRGPTPDEFRAEFWMSVILGFNGIMYFSHRVAGGFVEDATPQNIDVEMKRAAKDVADYQSFIVQPSVPLTLPLPFVGCTKTLNGQTITIILNLSGAGVTYGGRLYPAYEYTISGGTQPPKPQATPTLQSLDTRLKAVELKLGM